MTTLPYDFQNSDPAASVEYAVAEHQWGTGDMTRPLIAQCAQRQIGTAG